VAVTVEDKRRLRGTGASAVEMEAEAVCSRAADWNVPFYCVRAVSDGAQDAFALDLNSVRDRNGRFSKARIVMQALRNPVRLLPELWRLKRNSDLAAKNLGEFVADCSF
jgi:nucleoside phosphorylase